MTVEDRMFRVAGGAPGGRARQRGRARSSTASTTSSSRSAAVVCAAVMVALDRRSRSGPTTSRLGARPPLLVADLAVAVGADRWSRRCVKGAGLQRDGARLLGDGRAARLGGPLAVGRRPGRRRRAERRSTCRSARTSRRPTTATPSCCVLGGTIVGFLVESLQLMAAERDRGPARGGRRRASGPGWPAPCTTGCSRCSRWCSAAAPSSAVRRPSWAGWRASRRSRCAP